MNKKTLRPSRLRSGHRAGHFVGLLWASTALAAATPLGDPPPSVPDYAELERMFGERMGHVALRDPAMTADGIQVVFQTGHASGITAVALSRDGRYVLSGAQDETARLWSLASGQEVRTLTGFDLVGPRMVGFSADGARMIVADLKGVNVFDVASGEKLRSLGGLTLSPMVSGDGRVGIDGGIRGVARSPSLVDLVTGQVIWTVPVDGQEESVIALSADGATLLTRKRKQGRAAPFSRKPPQTEIELRVWDVATRKVRGQLRLADDGTDDLNAIVLSPDGARLLIENSNRSLSIYDLATAREIVNLPTGMAARSALTTTLLFSPDGNKIAFATADGHAGIWELATGRQVATLEASALNFSADGKTIVIGNSAGGAPSLRDLDSGTETTLVAGVEAILDVAVTHDGQAVAAAMMGGDVKLWDLGTAQLLRSFHCPSGIAAASVSASAVVPLVAVGCMDGSASLWDVSSGQKVRDLLPKLAAGFAPARVRFGHDGHVVAVAVQDVLSVFDVTTGQQRHQLKLPPNAKPHPLAYADSAADGTDQQDESDGPAADKTRNSISALALHPDGRLIAIGRSSELALWDAETGKIVRRLGGATAQADADKPRASAGLPGGASMAEVIKQLGGGKSKGSAGLLGGLLGAGGNASQGAAVNPMEMLAGIVEDAKAQLDGATSLAFSPDGRTLLSLGSQGKRLWDVATGQQIRSGKAPSFDATNPQAMMDSLFGEEMGAGGGAAFSADGRFAAHGIGRIVKITDVASGRDVAQLVGHTSNVSAVAFADGGRLLVSGGFDGAVRVWALPAGKELAALIALGPSDYVAVTPDQYYRASKSRIKGVAFRVRDQLYPFEQFDLRFNRPDIVLQRLGLAAPEAVQSYRQAYERRLRKMGFNEAMLGADFHLPELVIVTKDVPVSTAAASLTLRVLATDKNYPLDRLNVFVNDVPVYGTAGLALATPGTQRAEQEIAAPLVAGRNKVQVSVLNAQGTESLRQTVYVTATADPGPADIYVVAIGVSEYKNRTYSLRYAAKDAGDLLGVYGAAVEGRPAPHGQVHQLDLTNSKATRDGIRQAREFLAKARSHDLVVVFAAGHGMIDAKQNYYFGTWDIDAAQPGVNGLPYEDFEALLDGIPALQKVLLIDTCFSGEIDQDEPTVVAAAVTAGDGTVKMRAFKARRGVSVVADSAGGAGAQASAELVRFQQDWFADLRRGTGAVVISSASGNEYALEGEQWRNGVFTYALLNGLKNRAADANKDGVVAVSELQAYVIDQVRKLTNGGQNPTVRRENLEYDFAVY